MGITHFTLYTSYLESNNQLSIKVFIEVPVIVICIMTKANDMTIQRLA